MLSSTRALNQAAPLLFLALWSTSFLATRAGLRHMGPLWFVGIRMVLAAAILTGAMLALRRRWPPPRLAMHCAVAGVLTNAILLMTAHRAMVHIEGAPIALIQTLNPLLSALLAWPLLGERLRPSQLVGLILGFAGVLLILGRAALASHAAFADLLGTVAGVFALCGGTLYYRRFCRAAAPLPGAAVQFLACAALCMTAALTLETPWCDGDIVFYVSLGWNTIFISIGGMALYFLMLSHGTAARATANFYLVPGVVSVLSWLVLNEHLSALTLTGLVVSSAGCWLVARGPGCAIIKPGSVSNQV